MNQPRFDASALSSDEPLAMQNLSDAQQDKLGRLLERYLESLESGLPPTVESLTRDCPDLREALAACVEGLQNLHQLAGGGTTKTDQPLAPEPESEHRLGDFDLHEEVGRGGMGVVYRGTQRSLNRTVAVKILPLAAVLDPRQLTRFQHEAEAAASLQHPNIVPVFAVGCERGVHFYAMRFIRGQSIADWISDHEVTDWQVAVAMVADVAEGLHAAHEFGIVHRDVKPSNLLLDPTGKIWITDFGLARIQAGAAITQSGDVVGTARYMSPEQARGESALVDGRGDVYSLAATLYEMLTLHPAHDGDDTPTILRAIDESAIKPLRHWRTDLPRDLQTVVDKAMAVRRDDRYETAEQFADDLRRVMTGAPTIARPPTIVDRSVRLANKYKHAVLAASLVGLLAVIGFATATAKLAAAKQVSDAHAEQSLHKEGIAREAIDRLGNQVAQSLSGIPAANAVRHQLLQETLDYYQQFADAPPVNGFTDRRRAEDLAVTFGKMGVLQSELGDYESAVGSLKSSESGFRELAAANAGDPSLQLRWTISQNNLAEGLVKFGDHEAATQCFTDAIAMQRQMHQSGDKAASVELAKTLNNLAGMLAETDHDDAATLAYGQAIKLLDSFEAHSDLRATMQSNLAGVLASREPAAAAELARSSLIRQLGALESNPGNPKLATQVVVTLNTLAKAHSHSANHKAAVQTLRQAADVGRQLHTRWPDQLSYRRDLVVSLNALGMSLSKLGRLEPAGVALKQAAMHGRKLNDVLPESAEVQSMLGGVLNNLGSLQQQLGHPTAARECFHEAFEHQQIAADLAPQESRYRTLLETHQVNLIRLGGDS